MKRTILLALFITCFASVVHSTTITVIPASSIADAIAGRNAWVSTNFPAGSTASLIETFESYAYGPWNQLTTGAGTFLAEPGGLPSDMSGTHTNQFTILNNSNTPFNGRYNTTAGGNDWLDSNDITKLLLTTAFNNLYFFINDVNDTGGTLQIRTQDGTSSTNFAAPAANGALYFVGITSQAPIGSIEFLNNTQHDGYGLDDFGKVNYPASVPEPANYLTAASGLLILLGAVRLRTRMGSAGPSRSPGRWTKARRGSAQ